MPDRLTMEVTRDGWTGGLQLSINKRDENNAGHGYRIAGPKFNGSGETLLTRKLDERDAEEIRRYLDAAFPEKPSGNWYDDWEVVDRDSDSNAILKHRPTEGLYRILPVEES